MSPPDAMRHALSHHEAGRYAAAETIYREILTQQPENADALHYLGLVKHQTGDQPEALRLLGRSIELNPSAAHYRNNLGKVYRMLGRFEEARAAYGEAIRLKPDYAEAYSNLGTLLAQVGRIPDAIKAYARAVELNSNLPDTHYQLGMAYERTGRLDRALSSLHRAVELRPDFVEAHNLLGVIYGKQNRLDQAVAAGRRAVRYGPSHAESYNNLATSYGRQNRLDQVIECCQRAVELKPDYADAWSNLANALKEKDRCEEALEACKRAIAIRPAFPEAHNNLGGTLSRMERLDESIASYETALRYDPKNYEAYSNLGNVLQKKGEIRKAIECYQRSIDLKPDYAGAYWNKSLALLLMGDYPQGWAEYEWRWQCPELLPQRRDLRKPRWDGTDAPGATILLYGEQGYGDMLQFARYVPVIAQRGLRVILETQPELASLLKCLPAEVVAHGERIPPYTFQLPLLSVPAVLETRVETIPNQVPYITSRPALVERWRQRLAGDRPALKVGVVWAGRPEHKNDRNRSCPLPRLAPLGDVPSVTLYSLQKGPGAAQLCAVDSPAMIDLGEEIASFEDTAAVIANLDLVISVDTSVAHLAGAMGKATWTLLPAAPDWRWLLKREDSPWYPTMRLFRQPTPGDWAAVAKCVVAELAKLATAKAASGA